MRKSMSIILSAVLCTAAAAAYAENSDYSILNPGFAVEESAKNDLTAEDTDKDISEVSEEDSDAGIYLEIYENGSGLNITNEPSEGDAAEPEEIQTKAEYLEAQLWEKDDQPEISETSSDTWSEIANMITARASSELVLINGVIYAVAGVGESGYLNVIEKYNAAENCWQSVTTIPGEVKGFGVAAGDGKIYIVGGYGLSGFRNTVKAYDTASDEWSELPSMKEKRDQAACLYMNNKLYVFGGRNEVDFVKSYEFYDFSDGVWRKVTTGFDDSIIRAGSHVKYIGGYLCFWGGADTSFNLAGVDLYSSSNLKSRQSVLPAGFDDISLAWGDNEALIFYWDSEAGAYAASVMLVDGEEISLINSAVNDLTAVNKYSRFIINGGYLYSIGGYNLLARKYLQTVRKYSAYYGDFSDTGGAITNSAAADGSRITISVKEGVEYLLFVNAKNVNDFSNYEFKIEYPEGAFTLTDGCAFTAAEDTGTGAVNGTDITITENSAEGISFVCEKVLPSQTTVSQTVNAVLLKPNSSGQFTITYGMNEVQ